MEAVGVEDQSRTNGDKRSKENTGNRENKIAICNCMVINIKGRGILQCDARFAWFR